MDERATHITPVPVSGEKLLHRATSSTPRRRDTDAGQQQPDPRPGSLLADHSPPDSRGNRLSPYHGKLTTERGQVRLTWPLLL